MKTSFLILLALVLSNTGSYAQDNVHELTFENYCASRSVLFRIFPVSMVFNGFDDFQQTGFQYNLLAMHPSKSQNNPWKYLYINGRNDSINSYLLVDSSYVGLNHDVYSTLGGSYACVGYGIYKVNIQWDSGFDTCTVEWDAGYPFQTDSIEWSQDLSIIVRENGGNPTVLFEWGGSNGIETPIADVGKKIVAWDQQYDSQNRRRLRSKQFGTFKYDSSSNNPYSEIPLDCRADCGSENQITDNSYRSGYLPLNLTIDKNIHTRDTLLDSPTSIIIGKHAAMKIAAGRTFEMITPSDTGQSAYTDLVVGDSAFLILYGGSRLIVHAPNRLTLKNMSNLTLALGSAIIFKAGSVFCRDGGRINGFRYNMIFEKGKHNFDCDFESPLEISDSGAFVLNDSAVISLPDNFTLHLSGNETALILNPSSKLLFGENSGIVCDSGARLIADNATFSSVDSTKRWNGISLNDPSHDTIRNCTIKNAMYGIALSGKYDADESPEPYSSEISGCSFVNTTTYVLNNAVYLENSAHVLVKYITVSSTNLSIGFTHGIYAEYCPGEMLNIVGNCIMALTNC